MKFQNYANGFSGHDKREIEYTLEVPTEAPDPDAERIIVQTFSRHVALGLLQLDFGARRAAAELLLTEIRASHDQTARFSANNGCAAKIVQQSWTAATVIVINSY